MIDTFRPLFEAASGLDLSDPQAAEETLRERLDPQGELARALNAELIALLEAGSIAERGAPPLCWGRVAGAGPETQGYSIDAVHMSAAGPLHRHPAGEIDWCVPLKGTPKFDDRPPGWVVLGPGSEHVPTVTDGSMLVVYLLPGGSIEFLEG